MFRRSAVVLALVLSVAAGLWVPAAHAATVATSGVDYTGSLAQNAVANYTINLLATSTINVFVGNTCGTCDFDLKLYNASNTLVASSIGPAGVDELISNLRLPGGSYTASVINYSATGSYKFRWRDVSYLIDSDARARLSNAGISVLSSGGCSNRYDSNCTSLEQIRLRTIEGVIDLKTYSGCTIQVTGGTEVGHETGSDTTTWHDPNKLSHWNGYKIDIALNSCVSSYIQTRYTQIATRSDGAKQYQDGVGDIYALESNHWDITYK